MAPLSGKMHIMLFFNNTSKVKEGPLNLSCELIWGFGSDHWSECFFIDEWMIWSIYALLPWTLWLILPVFSHRQRSMLTADEAGITGLPQKRKFPLFRFWPSYSFCAFCPLFFDCDALDLHGKNEVLAREKITLQRLLIVLLWIDKVQCQMGGRVSQEKLICHCSWTSWKTTSCLVTTQYAERAQTSKAWQIYIYGLPMDRAIFYFINAKVKHKDSPNYKYDLASALINNTLFHFHFHCQRKEVFHLLPVLFVIRPLTV